MNEEQERLELHEHLRVNEEDHLERQQEDMEHYE